jgi:hypothetical protein
LQSNGQFGYLEIEQMLPKNVSGLALLWKKLGYEPTG